MSATEATSPGDQESPELERLSREGLEEIAGGTDDDWDGPFLHPTVVVDVPRSDA